ncbi:MmyB family transcriptional regulator [Paraburkholderia kirstenboschensis]|uniref:MmyB family transcriptional regulator n=1 Tax=Paraburkholderia kirstenboschensis TaxID=1245436 RepID=UPI0037428935
MTPACLSLARSPRGAARSRDRHRHAPKEAVAPPTRTRRVPRMRPPLLRRRGDRRRKWEWADRSQSRGDCLSWRVPRSERIARALLLTDVEREHLFLLALGRPPEIRYRDTEGVTPRLQRVLDSLQLSPPIIRTATWDVVAWNRAAAAMLTDYGRLPPEQRNKLRLIVCNPRVRAAQSDWESVARFVVAAFRADAARAGAASRVAAMVDELCRLSPDFEAIWRDNDVRSHGGGVKHLRHPIAGPIGFEYSAFAVDGRPDLGMVVYTPLTPDDARKVAELVKSRGPGSS